MYPKALVQEIIDLRTKGMSRKAIAERIGLTPSKIKYILQHNKIYLTHDQLIVNLEAGQSPEVQERKRVAMLEFSKNSPEVVKARSIKIKQTWFKPEVLEKQ